MSSIIEHLRDTIPLSRIPCGYIAIIDLFCFMNQNWRLSLRICLNETQQLHAAPEKKNYKQPTVATQ